jgi:hypothetical protein
MNFQATCMECGGPVGFVLCDGEPEICDKCYSHDDMTDEEDVDWSAVSDRTYSEVFSEDE